METKNIKFTIHIQTTIWVLICVILFVISYCVVPSPTIVVESLVITSFAAIPRTFLPPLSEGTPISSELLLLNKGWILFVHNRAL